MPIFKSGAATFDFPNRAERLNEQHQSENIARSQTRLGELERIVAFLLAKMIQGEPVTLKDDPVRRFLRIPEAAEDSDDPRYLQLALAALEPIGLIECPECGTKVRDIPGFLEESCPFCGAHVGSER